ncbi:carbonic anhydrase [Parafrankia sp. EUN1f]|uniref:beta-class carbonic anhydrase n=1 Tax=Parafrankia sp. EUN1f TaxID=102897 RepID=UPI0001C46B63|nr:carbonic anhydrase [Parafrankia sp. EUN1f]EFC86268.1 carbonic anhydrase [Parafrankia sp. EUN1f]
MSAPEDVGPAQGATRTLLARAADFAALRGGTPERPPLPGQPATGVAVVACMDARLNVEALFGLAEGDAHIVRNAGGVVTEDVERSLAVSQHALGTTEIILVHHTRCGMEQISDEGFSEALAERTGVRPPWRVRAFADVAVDVLEGIRTLRSSPFLRASTSVRGFVYDVDSGELQEITESSLTARKQGTSV